jgi:hypothetical protein
MLTAFIIFVVGIIGYSKISSTGTSSNSNSNDQNSEGISIVLLLDFSMSFPASISEDGRIIYGFRQDDQNALEALVNVMAEKAVGATRFKTVWSQIQSSSIIEDPLCPPIEMSGGIIKRQNTLTSREQWLDTLKRNVSYVFRQSKVQKNLAHYTDISGAVAMAGEVSNEQYTERIIIILSDFLEDLPEGSIPARFKLNGEHIIMLHRPGTDERENIDGYLARINNWKHKFIKQGAKYVSAIPVFAVSPSRISASLKREEIGSSIVIIGDGKNNKLSRGNTSQTKLLQIGKSLAELSNNLPVPITALWMSIGETGFKSKSLPLVEYDPHIIKRDKSLNTVQDFAMVMQELAHALPGISSGVKSTDISGTLALVNSIDPPAKSNILVVISDFIDDGPQPHSEFKLSPNTRVAMIHSASDRDRNDPNKYITRREEWQNKFIINGAISVCQIPFGSLTRNDLKSCLDK